MDRSPDSSPPRQPLSTLGNIAASDAGRLVELLGLVDAALAAVDPTESVARILDDAPLPGHRVTVIAIGKAAPGMAMGAHRALGPRIERCLVVCDHAEAVPPGAELILGSHPVPDEASLAAGRRLLEVAAEPTDHVLFLVSGGGSALAEVPVEGIPPEDLVAVYELLLRSGMPIQDANVVRTQMSALKGGKLATAARAPFTTIVVSDVGGPVELVASGPTIPTRSSPADARAVLERHSLTGDMPPSVSRRLASLPVAPPDLPPGPVMVAGDGAVAAAAAADAARSLSMPCRVVTTGLAGEARDAAIRALRESPVGEVGIFAGETTVTVRGSGQGGRNQEAALAAAVDIAGSSAAFLAFGTDGIDGPTDAAGAYVDGGTAGRLHDAGVEAENALADNDSHPALDRAGALIRCGPTGVNVADLWLVDKR